MTAPVHHPSDAILTDYASGAMRPAFAVAVAAHLEACAHCRITLRGLEALGGQMIADLPESEMSGEALDRVMAGIERPLDAAPAAAIAPAVKRIPFGREMWIGPGMGLRKAKLKSGDLLYQLRLPAGLGTIPHGHQGTEYTVVLKGAFMDGEVRFGPGDFAEMVEIEDETHTPHVTDEGECVCLIVSEKPMRVTTLLGRFVQLVTQV
jgi:putative transcriptional regulator